MAITTQYKVIEEVEIDFIYKNPSPIIMCPQFEGGERAIKVKLKNAGVEFPVPSGYTPHVFMLKFDKKVVDNICEYDGSVVMVKVTKQMSFVEGRNLMRIALVSDTTGEYAQTCEIYLRVTEGADVDGAEQSTDEFEALVMYANQAKDSADKAAQSEQNAEASKTAAQAALQGALEAEDRVQAIVAGNEAYTKQQSHDLFAAALVTKTGPAASLEVYPDKLSNLKVYANGFTTQAGTGDPSPTNVRALTCGGLRMVELVLTGKETFYLNNPWSAGNYVASYTRPEISADISRQSFCNQLQKNTSAVPQVQKGFVLEQNAIYVVLPKSELSSQDSAGIKAWLAARYAAGNPVTVWYAPADESQATGLYAPIILQSGEYRATCLELTAPLCEGDSVVSWAKSGCDKVLVLDGSQSMSMTGDGLLRITVADAAVGFPLSTYVPAVTPYQNSEGVYSPGNGTIAIKHPELSSVEAAQAYLPSHPLTVWYRSTNYTEADDIPVSLETHAQAYLELAISNMDNDNDNYPGWVLSGLSSIVGSGVNATIPDAVCNMANGVGANTTDGQSVLYFTKVGGLTQSQLKAQYPGLVAQITLPYKTTITYAHPAVVLPALPDNTGKVTITGQSGGTVTVVFNKSIIKEIAEIKAAVLAMGANLSM